MTTTSLLPHKPPPLKPRNNPAVFLRSNYYGSVGRPSNGKRKSAVELLEETKAFYVKSESVLDAKQELKNADHLHVRSPTVDVAMLRSPAPPIINGGGPFPFAMCLTCPPYPHQHFEHFDHYQIHQNAHNHHLSQGSLHQQQHHLSAPLSGGHQAGNSSGPPSVESGGTASTGSTGGGGVTAITTLGRSTKHHQHSHSHHHHHSHSHHHSSSHHKSHRSSSTGSSGSRHLQENSGLLIDPGLILSKSNTIGRTTKRSIQPPGSLPMPKPTQKIQIRKDSSNVIAALLPGMSFTLPAQSSLQKQQHNHHLHQHHHHHHHSHHHQLLLQQQQQALASLSSSTTNATLSLPSAPAPTSTNATTSTAASTTAANGLRNSVSAASAAAAGVAPLVDKHSSLVSANNGSLAPVITSTSTSSTAQQTSTGQTSSAGSNLQASNHGTGLHRERNKEDDSPPPLPPKSPRITSKPTRPHDFPQQLQLQLVDSSVETTTTGGNVSALVPPPPPRRQSQVDPQAKYLRLLQDQSSNKLPHSIIDPSQSMTLPSPILPPTPPPDVVMESPMSDSGPIISPPPAFSTPVTPMIDRQNSTTSDKSGGAGVGGVGVGGTVPISTSTNPTSITTSGPGVGRLRSLSQSTSHYHNITGFSSAVNVSSSAVTGAAGTTAVPANKPHSQPPQPQHGSHHYHAPLSGTVSMSAISSVSGRSSSTRNNKSIPDLSSDVSMRYSPMSRSRSNSSPMSPEESIPASSPEDDDDDDDADEDPTSSSVADNGHDGDDDCSEKGQLSSISPKLLAAGVVRRNSAKHISTHHHLQQNKKITLIPKSVTENFLFKVGSNNTGANAGGLGDGGGGEVLKTSNTGAQTEANQQSRVRGSAEAPSPARRPILRSKSDLSHRYAKASEKSATLTPGFTLVHVDLGLPPPLPMHNPVPTNDFPNNQQPSGPVQVGGGGPPPHKSHHHHIYQTPNSVVNSTANKATSHYHEPHNPQPHPHPSHEKRATKSASDLERFFDMLGLENTPTPAPLPLAELKEGSRARAGSESPVFFSSVSSVDSAPRRSGSADSEDSPLDDKLGSRTVGGYGKFGPAGGPTILVQHGEPSIVERNARVIKWLFNCRKAMERR